MEVIDAGHKYKLKNLHYHTYSELQFYKDPDINGSLEQQGTNCQEVIRALINRVEFLDNQKPWEGNKVILQHLRETLALFEARAIIRKVDKGLLIESLPVGSDGHLIIKEEE